MTDIDLALCDVNMPRMNGLDMIAEVQRTGPKIPILMLTTEGQPSLIKRAREAGAKGWIVKPFKPELLVAAVVKLIEPRPVPHSLIAGTGGALLPARRARSIEQQRVAGGGASVRARRGFDLESFARLELDPHRGRAVGQRELDRLELRARERRQ